MKLILASLALMSVIFMVGCTGNVDTGNGSTGGGGNTAAADQRCIEKIGNYVSSVYGGNYTIIRHQSVSSTADLDTFVAEYSAVKGLSVEPGSVAYLFTADLDRSNFVFLAVCTSTEHVIRTAGTSAS